MFHQTLDRAEAGDQVGALLRGLKRDDIRRGYVVAKPGTVSMHNRFAAQVVIVCSDFIEKRLYTKSKCISISIYAAVYVNFILICRS